MSTVVLRKNGTAIPGATITGLGSGQTKKVTLTDEARKYVQGVDKFTFVVDGGPASPEEVIPEGRWVQEFRCTADASGEHIVITMSVT